MRLVIFILIALAGALALSMYATHDPGYVVLSHDPYTVRLPMALFVLFLLILFAVLYLIFNFLVSLFRAPKKVKKWRKGKQELSAQQQTMKGFAGLIEGNWADAEGNLLSKIDHNNASLMNFLGAAYAAQQQGQIARRNQHLSAALESHPRQELAIKLTRARMQMQAGEFGDARDQLEYLRLSAPRNVAVARLLADAYRELNDWPALVSLMPSLGKLKAFPAEELKARERDALEHHIEAPALLPGDGSKVDEAFKALPRKKKKDAAAVASYARQLIRSGEGQRAETVLRKALNREWNPELVKLYGLTETRHGKDQLKLIESWAKKYGDDPQLIFAMARLYRRDNQLDKAKELYAQVVAATGDSEAIAEMGDLLEQMGDPDSALLAYKQGLKALTGPNPLGAEVTQTESALVALDVDPIDSDKNSAIPAVTGPNPA
ncbi:MAG: heme biosynthesis protein HemY [bacterium]